MSSQPVVESSTPGSNTPGLAIHLPAEAQTLLDRLDRDFPRNSDVLNARGRILAQFGQADSALACWEEALRLDPGLTSAQLQLARFAAKSGELELAVQRFQKASETAPQLPGVHLSLGQSLLSLGRYEDAAIALQREVELSPRSTEARFRLGQAYLELKKFERAKESFESGLQIFADCQPAWFGLAQTYEQLGDTAKAGECRARFLQLDEVRAKFEREKPLRQEKEFLQRQALAVASADLAELYFLYGNAPEAEELAREACALDPQQVECRRGLAELLARQNRAAEATAVLQELRALEPENVEYLLGLAKLHKQLGQFADADAQLKAALRKEPENPQVLAALVQLLLDWRQQLPEAQRLAQRLVELQPSGPNYFLLFNVRMLSADEDGGRRALEEAIRRDPQNPNYARAAAALGTK